MHHISCRARVESTITPAGRATIGQIYPAHAAADVKLGTLLKMQDLKARDLPGMRRAFVASVWLSGPRLLCRGVLMNTLLLLMTFVLVDDLRPLHSVTVLK